MVVQGVRDDHRAGQVDAVEKGDEGRDLVALPVELPLGEDMAAVGHRGDDSDGEPPDGARAAECLAVDGDDLASGGRGLAFLEEVAYGAVECVAVHGGQGETDGRGVGRPDQTGQRSGRNRAGPGRAAGVGDPLCDRRDRGVAGQNGGGSGGEQGRPRVTDAATGSQVRYCGQITLQVSERFQRGRVGGAPQFPEV